MGVLFTMEINKVLPLGELGKPEAFEGWGIGSDPYMELRCRVGLLFDGAGEPLRPGMYLDGVTVHPASSTGSAAQEYGEAVFPDLHYLPISHKGVFPSSMVRVGHSDPSVSPYDWFANKGLLQNLSPRLLLTNLVYSVVCDRRDAPEYWKDGYAPWFRGGVFTSISTGKRGSPYTAYYEGVSGERFVVGGVDTYSLSAVGGCDLQLYPSSVPPTSSSGVIWGKERSRATAYLLSGVVQKGAVQAPPQYTRGALWGGLEGKVPSWWTDYCLTVTGLLPCATLDAPLYHRVDGASDGFGEGTLPRGDSLRAFVSRKEVA